MPTAFQLRYGRDEPPAERIPLRAGPLTLCFEAGDLRYIKLGEQEVIRCIYAAVRDHNWGTVPGAISDEQYEIAEDSFRIRYLSQHHQGEIHFIWRAEIIGETDGTIRFTFDGEAKTTFLKNRIGFCALHPIRECAGVRCRAHYTSGRKEELTFPKLVAAEQPVKGLHDLASLTHEIKPGVWAELRFEGDVFETEDQRNWIDASFKTFCTPLKIPYPVEVKAGTCLRQSVELRLAGDRLATVDGVGAVAVSPPRSITIEIDDRTTSRLPLLGLGVASHGQPITDREVRRLMALRLNHLRVDLKFDDERWRTRLAYALQNAERLQTRIELALHVSNLAADDLKDLVEELTAVRLPTIETRQRSLASSRILVFTLGEKSTSEHSLRAVQRFVQRHDLPLHDIMFGAGTNADFYQLNQFRPPGDADFICWSMNSQVHAFDNGSLAETPEAVPQQVASAKEYFRGAPMVISPITLKPRFNPVATGPEPPLSPGELPPQVDPRQMSLLGAGWTLAMLKQLAESDVDSATFYETTGWCGIMETEAGPPLPVKFPSIPGAVFPLYHVFADLGEFAGGQTVISRSSKPLRVESLVLRHGERLSVLLANLSSEPQSVTLNGLSGSWQVRRLNETNAVQAMREPEAWRTAQREVLPNRSQPCLELMAFEVVNLLLA